MKKKTSAQSAFFNPRALLGFALCLLGVVLAFFAFNSLTGSSVHAQGISQKGNSAKANSVVSAPAPSDMKGVAAIQTLPLREIPPINPEKAPGHDHPEPMQPAGPTLGAGPDTARQTTPGRIKSAPTATGLSFDGVGVGLAGFAPSSNPPDVEGKVGATQYVQWNNTSFAVFDKATGALLYGPAAGNTLFQSLGGVCASHNDGDPVVSYDILSGRWILSQFVVNGGAGSASHQCVAVSTTGDATGTWYTYDFVTDTLNFLDYPHMAVWPDGYYMSAHIFNSAGTALVAARVYVFERSAMINGQTARMQSANLTTFGANFQYGFLPADLDSLTPPPVGEAEFVLGPHPTTFTLTASTRVAVTWGAIPTITLTEATLTNTTYTTAYCVGSGRLCVPQSGQANAAALDNIKSHFMYRLSYRNNGTQALPQESLTANIPVKGATNRDAIRWYEFRNAGNSTATPSIFQQSTYDPDTLFRWLGSTAMDKDGNIALGFSKSSSATFPGIWITGRLATDTINTMGAEVQMQAGAGSQDSTGGNRWGDYSSMTLDPVDQCTFYYTNEYLKTTGAFNWSTRVASYSFPSCVPAPAWGTLTGTITSTATGAPVSGVIVSLDNGFAGASNGSGVYSILVPAGGYTAVAADAARNCTVAIPASVPVSVNVGASTTQNFTMSGTSKLEANGLTVDDSVNGNNNGIINLNECFNVNANVKNNGCGTETAISATLTTSTAGVTVVNGTSAYPDLVIDASANNTVPFQVQTSNSFACGTPIVFSLNLTYASGSKTVTYTVPTCAGGANQTIPASSITTGDPSQPDRMGRTGLGSTCAGKACPGAINSAGSRNYKTFTFTNSSAAAACFTATINAALGGGGDIESAAYQTMYTPPIAQGDPNGFLCLNYLGDSGISGLGTTVGTASYSFTVAPNSNFVIVVNTTTGSTNSSVFSGTISGFVDNTSGPGPCPAAPAPVLVSGASRLTSPAGTFDVNLPLSTPYGVEDRNGAGSYLIVFTFNNPVQSGSATMTGTGTVGTPTFSGNEMRVPLTGVTDIQNVTVTANNVMGTNGGVLASATLNVGFLIGDTNGDTSVNSADVGQTKSQTGATVTTTNFREDVNIDGVINSADVGLVKSKSGNGL
ncbi:MAG: dockerin type I domain-containing protein [Chthoniobacterales bacterium]